jgi:hypothetical protein
VAPRHVRATISTASPPGVAGGRGPTCSRRWQIGLEFLIVAVVPCKSREPNHLGVFKCNLLSLIEIGRRTGNVTVCRRCDFPAAIGAPLKRDRSLPGCGDYASKFVNFQPFRSSTTSRIGTSPSRRSLTRQPVPGGRTEFRGASKGRPRGRFQNLCGPCKLLRVNHPYSFRGFACSVES